MSTQTKAEEALNEFEILIYCYKDKWDEKTYNHFEECAKIIKDELKDCKTLKREYDFLSEHYKELLHDYNKKVVEEDACFGCPAYGQTYREGEAPCHVCPEGRKKGF